MSNEILEPEKQDLLTRLAATHVALKAKVRQLQNQPVLTEAERLEYAQLKKMKLLTKDRIHFLRQT